MAFSKYYTGYQPRQRQPDNQSDLLEYMRRMQEQMQQQSQQNQPSAADYQNIGKLGKSIFGSSGGSGGTPTNIDMTPPASGGGGDIWNLFGQTPTSGSPMASPAGGSSWHSAFANPAVAIPAAVIAAANVAHNKGISSWGDTLKGQLGGNTVDYYAEGNHGIGSKIFDKDNPISAYEPAKFFTDLATLDLKNAAKHGGNALMGPLKALKKLF